ncbi:unnamed protein product [Polarella glacialis]|uniref:Uncharacterized protein n=1 Tax=Polarella glacialis TaxID=89957 RepID=A0A813HCA6_POLGL|nr:unnamed protein product [Polarella glacialis]
MPRSMHTLRQLRRGAKFCLTELRVMLKSTIRPHPGGSVVAAAFAPFDWGGLGLSEASVSAKGTRGISAKSSLSDGIFGLADTRDRAPELEDGANSPSFATLESMMGRLSTRLPPAASDSVVFASETGRSRTSLGGGQAFGAAATGGVRLNGTAPEAVPTSLPVPPLPGTASQSERPQRTPAGVAMPFPVTPVGDDRRRTSAQASRYSIGSATPEQAHGSPWWQSDPAGMEGHSKDGFVRQDQKPDLASPVAAMEGSPTDGKATAALAAAAEVLAPLLAELRRDMRKDIQEAQCALMEQNFRLHSELRKDMDELRAEVQQLRGELRVL